MKLLLLATLGFLFFGAVSYAADPQVIVQKEFKTNYETLWSAISEVISKDLGMQIRNSDKAEGIIETFAESFDESKSEWRKKVMDDKRFKRLPESITGSYLLTAQVTRKLDNVYFVKPAYKIERWKPLKLGGQFEEYRSSGLLEENFLKALTIKLKNLTKSP